LLANRYETLLSDSLSMASFYTESTDVDLHNTLKVINVDALRHQFIEDYAEKNINIACHHF